MNYILSSVEFCKLQENNSFNMKRNQYRHEKLYLRFHGIILYFHFYLVFYRECLKKWKTFFDVQCQYSYRLVSAAKFLRRSGHSSFHCTKKQKLDTTLRLYLPSDRCLLLCKDRHGSFELFQSRPLQEFGTSQWSSSLWPGIRCSPSTVMIFHPGYRNN